MEKSGPMIHEITFAQQDSLILVPPKMLAESISRCQKGLRAQLMLDEFFPPDLIRYLENVIEINRLLPPSPHASSDWAAAEGGDALFPLVLLQLGSLRVDRRIWFAGLEYHRAPGQENLLHIQYTREAQEIGKKGGLFLHRPEDGMQKGGTSFTLNPAS